MTSFSYTPPTDRSVTFPDGFLWGAATAAYQVEAQLMKMGAAIPFGTLSPEFLVRSSMRTTVMSLAINTTDMPMTRS